MSFTFKENLKALRETAGLRQQELAERLGTTQRKISYWENGKYEPDIENLCKLAEFFAVTIDELIVWKD